MGKGGIFDAKVRQGDVTYRSRGREVGDLPVEVVVRVVRDVHAGQRRVRAVDQETKKELGAERASVCVFWGGTPRKR
jgi:hypothetical protein